jgi:hypothetical protein
MRKFNILVWDDFIAGAGTVVYTRPELNDRLADPDQLGLFAVTDQVTGASGNISVQIQHSADGINWTNKNTTAEINAASLSTTATNVAYGSDSGATPAELVVFDHVLSANDRALLVAYFNGRYALGMS